MMNTKADALTALGPIRQAVQAIQAGLESIEAQYGIVPDDYQSFILNAIAGMQVYCHECRDMVQVENPEFVRVSGMMAIKGECPNCGSSGPASIEEALSAEAGEVDGEEDEADGDENEEFETSEDIE